jgi:hypothetical protein
MNQTVYEKGIEKGIEKGVDKGIEKERRDVVLCQLTERFGPLSPATREHIDRMTMEELRRVVIKFVSAGSLSELGIPAE